MTVIVLEALHALGLVPARTTAAVQGFRKVGAHVAKFLGQAGVRVQSVSDQFGAIYAENGIDISALGDYVAREGTVVGFSGAEPISAVEQLELPVGLLAPCAGEGVLHIENAARVQARVIVEGANGSTTPEADAIFREHDILVVPDILANAGGVIVSYFEWVQSNQAYRWSARQVESRLSERLKLACRQYWPNRPWQAGRCARPVRQWPSGEWLTRTSCAACIPERKDPA